MAKKSGFRRNPPRDWKEVTVSWLSDSQYYQIPWIRKFVSRLDAASSDTEILKLKKELEKFLTIMETGGELEHDEVEDINQALLMGSLMVGQSGMATTAALKAPARREPEPEEDDDEELEEHLGRDRGLREPTEEEIRKALRMPDDFGYRGRLPIGETWSIGPVIRTRDSKLLESSNADALLAALKNVPQFRGEYEIVQAGHWAVGWVDHLAFHAVDENRNPTLIFKWLNGWFDALEEYPIANEHDYVERQVAVIRENIDDAVNRIKTGSVREEEGWKERVYDWLQENGSRESRRSLEDPENYSILPEDMEEALRDLGLFVPDEKFEVRLVNSEEDPFIVNIYADVDEVIGDEYLDWETFIDSDQALVIMDNAEDLPETLRAEGYIVDASEWFWPPAGLPGQLKLPMRALPELAEPIPEQDSDAIRAWINVKGTKEEAFDAAWSRGFTVDLHDDIREGDTHVSFYARGTPKMFVSWFAEPPSAAPYPPGSLLFYRFAEKGIAGIIEELDDPFLNGFFGALMRSVGAESLDEIDSNLLRRLHQDCIVFVLENDDALNAFYRQNDEHYRTGVSASAEVRELAGERFFRVRGLGDRFDGPRTTRDIDNRLTMAAQEFSALIFARDAQGTVIAQS